jgi:hypothetical protein
MNRPATGEDHEAVEDLDGFAAYLLALAADAADATGTTTWLNTTIEDFLGALATLLAAADANPSAEGKMPEPTTWKELAVLLYKARSHQLASPAPTNDQVSDAKSVEGRHELVTYILWLIIDLRRDRAEAAERTRESRWAREGRWAHWVLSSWLEAWGSWLRDAYLKPLPPLMVKLGITREPIEPVGYRSIAIQLSGARIYE